MGHYPAGSSMQSGMHFAKNYWAQQFQEYDYGWETNYQLYGQGTPPKIDVLLANKAEVPVALFSGDNDLMSSRRDVL